MFVCRWLLSLLDRSIDFAVFSCADGVSNRFYARFFVYIYVLVKWRLAIILGPLSSDWRLSFL